jgi:hypothetical protein
MIHEQKESFMTSNQYDVIVIGAEQNLTPSPFPIGEGYAPLEWCLDCF